jgi:hypothetical protein
VNIEVRHVAPKAISEETDPAPILREVPRVHSANKSSGIDDRSGLPSPVAGPQGPSAGVQGPLPPGAVSRNRRVRR